MSSPMPEKNVSKKLFRLLVLSIFAFVSGLLLLLIYQPDIFHFWVSDGFNMIDIDLVPSLSGLDIFAGFHSLEAKHPAYPFFHISSSIPVMFLVSILHAKLGHLKQQFQATLIAISAYLILMLLLIGLHIAGLKTEHNNFLILFYCSMALMGLTYFYVQMLRKVPRMEWIRPKNLPFVFVQGYLLGKAWLFVVSYP